MKGTMEMFVGGVLAALGLIAGWIGRSFLVRSAEPRTNQDAISRHLDAIRVKVDATERTAANIKAQVEKGASRERRNRTLYRRKLEGTLAAVYSARTECQHRMAAAVNSDHDLQDDDEAANRLAVLVSLYFQELSPLRRQLMLAYHNIQKDTAELNSLWRLYRMRSQVADAAGLPALKAAHDGKCAALNSSLGTHWRNLLTVVIAFEKAAVALIPKYLPGK